MIIQTTGTLSGVEVHPREVFKPAIVHSAAAVIVAHNHPSGDPSPSRQDVEMTERLREAGKMLAALERIEQRSERHARPVRRRRVWDIAVSR